MACQAPPIIAGDALQCGAARVRLAGVVAPELSDRSCEAEPGRWACRAYVRIYARSAAARLEALTRGEVVCRPLGKARAGWIAARCEVGGYDLGALLVREGLVRTQPGEGARYRDAERLARQARWGVWMRSSRAD